MVNTCSTPADELPYSCASGPRSTSMRSADGRLMVEAWPWPSGMVAGMPSTMRRAPRMPKGAREPEPRMESCRSCA
ncbi:hypothetical protein FQZ97_838670 [compost metagenome]